MFPIFKAILYGDQVEWVDPLPDRQESVPIYITLMKDVSARSSQGIEMADSLQELAGLGRISSISDPVTWQRNLREDRSLSQRDLRGRA